MSDEQVNLQAAHMTHCFITYRVRREGSRYVVRDEAYRRTRALTRRLTGRQFACRVVFRVDVCAYPVRIPSVATRVVAKIYTPFF